MEYPDNELTYYFHDNNEEAIDLIYDKYKYIIDVLLNKYRRVFLALNIDVDEVRQEANLAFSNAIYTFSDDKDASLSTFISLCVERKIKTVIKKYETLKNKVFSDSISFDGYNDGISLENIIGDETYEPLKKIENIDTIEKLNLDYLSFRCFHLKDYSFLRNVCSSIKGLTVDLEDKTYKMDINDILHMTELESLAIRNVKTGLDQISKFKNLKELYLRSIGIKDYSFLREMNVKKIYLSFQNVAYFNTFGINETIEEVSLWMNKNLTDLSFLLQFPNLKKIIISNQKKVEFIPDLTGLTKLEEIYFLEKDAEEIRKHCNPNVKIHSYYNPVDIT